MNKRARVVPNTNVVQPAATPPVSNTLPVAPLPGVPAPVPPSVPADDSGMDGKIKVALFILVGFLVIVIIGVVLFFVFRSFEEDSVGSDGVEDAVNALFQNQSGGDRNTSSTVNQSAAVNQSATLNQLYTPNYHSDPSLEELADIYGFQEIIATDTYCMADSDCLAEHGDLSICGLETSLCYKVVL